MKDGRYCPVIRAECKKDPCIMWQDESCALVEYLNHVREARSISIPGLGTVRPKSGKIVDKTSAVGIDEIKGTEIDELAAQLLDFADREALINENMERFDYQLTEAFLESRGIDEFDAPSTVKSKMRKALKAAEKLLEKRQADQQRRKIDGFLSLSVDDLTVELVNFAKKTVRSPSGEQVWVHNAARAFWKLKGWEQWHAPVEVQARMVEIERAAQEVCNKESEEELRQKLLEEEATFPALVEDCTKWARQKGLRKITKQDCSLFLLERKKDLMSTTERALYLKVNVELKAK